MSARLLNGSFRKLRAYCERAGFSGWDPYDGLSSPVLRAAPVLTATPFLRQAWTQFFKRSPVNLRPLFFVPKTENAKALALFLSGYSALYRAGRLPEDKHWIDRLAQMLVAARVTGYSGSCWGYPFDWQSRAFFLPAKTPNIIVTTFAGNALLDAYEATRTGIYLTTARAIVPFLLNDLTRTPGDTGFCFSYSPLDSSSIYNASVLGGQFLARIGSLTGAADLREPARAAISYCGDHQGPDGAWYYGSAGNQRWVDGIHTAYILRALTGYERACNDRSFHGNIQRGFDYYQKHFITSEGIAKYYNTRTYPIEPHTAAAYVICMIEGGYLQQYRTTIERILTWLCVHMRSARGYFYFQKTPRWTNRICYMRWVQAWMFYALAMYHAHTDKGEGAA